ncbi:hypothetical protein RMCBS344292_14624 [Rhizopus microsporus]|nr:hypothetical protein RMCBS344292_14624 [Rhizopus microsporus]
MAVDTNRSCPPVPIWIELSKAQEQVERDNNNRPPLTSGSSDTDYTIITAASSIRTSFSLRDKREIIQQYEQRPEKTPDIASEMEKWYAMTDRYGFLNTQQTELLKEKEIERAEKWAAMSHRILIDGETAYTFSYSSKLRRRVYKGIPDCWRRDVWYYLVTDGLRSANEDYAYKKSYQELLLKESSHERQIDLDIPRTLRDHIMFKQRYGSGQRSLFNVLRAFSNYDEEVGYCQGMTNIVATILMYCDEERAFLMLRRMFLRDKLHDLYIPGFPTLMESFFIQDNLLKRYRPRLYHHLLGLSSDIYATRWYITLFTGGVVQYHTLLRIWDIYFLCGYDIFFFVVIALLKEYEGRLLSSDLDQCMEILGSAMSVSDDDVFIKSVQRLYERRSQVVKTLRKAYQESH